MESCANSAARTFVKRVIVVQNTNAIFLSTVCIFEDMSLKFRKPHIKIITFVFGWISIQIKHISLEHFLYRQANVSFWQDSNNDYYCF